MTTKTNTPTRSPQTEVAIEEPKAEVSTELRGMVDKKLKNLVGMWKERREQQKTILEASGPTLPGGYRYWDCLLLGPYQESTYELPSKLIVANEPALMVGLIWINPDKTPDGGVSGKVVLGGENYFTCFEMIDLSLVQNVVLPGSDSAHVFPNIPDDFTPIYWQFQLPDPGIHPRLYEVHFYVDIVRAGQPFAAMATWHWDPEGDGYIPGWTPTNIPPNYDIGNVPNIWSWGSHFDHDLPARFLLHNG